MPKYTRTETLAMWQWNGPEDNRGVVEQRVPHEGKVYSGIWSDKSVIWVTAGNWIIPTVTHYRVISNAKFKAQGWKVVAE